MFKELRMGVAKLQWNSSGNHSELESTPRVKVFSPTRQPSLQMLVPTPNHTSDQLATNFGVPTTLSDLIIS